MSRRERVVCFLGVGIVKPHGHLAQNFEKSDRLKEAKIYNIYGQNQQLIERVIAFEGAANSAGPPIESLPCLIAGV
jgi:hypothetical protein